MADASTSRDVRGDGHTSPSPAPAPPAPGPERGGESALRRLARRPLVVAAASALLVLAAVVGALYWRYAAAHESTDDAFVEARVIRISPRVSGHVARVAIDDNQQVSAGQLLVEIDERQYQAALEEARGREVAATAEARRTAADATRARELYKLKLIARAALDEAEAAERSSRAQQEAARAEVAARALDQQFTRLTAPEAGRVTTKTVEQGMFVQVGQPLMAIVTRDLWVVANFKETQIGQMHPGQSVDIRVDAFRGQVFRAHVDSIQRGTGARFTLLPPENATGNFVKVVQRVPVKIAFDEPPDPRYPLGPGMSVAPTVRVE